MSNLIPFQSEQFGQVRVVMVNDPPVTVRGYSTFIKERPWFVCKDVATALDYKTGSRSPTTLFKHIPEPWKKLISIQTPGGNQGLLCVNEQGLYFFLNRSDKPKAIPYQMYIVNEIMPFFDTRGGYQASINSEKLQNDNRFRESRLI
jgi:prophage antirepressor-like protein